MTAAKDGLKERLHDFEARGEELGKGSLALLLVLTNSAKQKDFPLDPADFITEGGGQVAGASGAAANRILAAHGVKVRLSAEGGRTNRGSISLMRRYVQCLNELHAQDILDINAALVHWVSRTESFLAAAPFKAKLADHQLSIRALINDLLTQAQVKQKTRPGATFTGTLMQHLAAAKLRMLLKERAPRPHGASDADSSRNTDGDFEINDTVLHVTAAPAATLLEKCRINLSSGKRPIVITLSKSVQHAQALAEELGIESRVEFWAFDQFLSTNAHEWGGFLGQDVRSQARELLQAYNDIIDELHEEPSLKIAF
jgi:hypothetical protein